MKQVGINPKEFSHIRHELTTLVGIQVRRHDITNQIVSIVWNYGIKSWDSSNTLQSRNESMISNPSSNFSVAPSSNLEKWSATWFLIPFLLMTSKSTSWRRSTYLINFRFASFFAIKYCSAEWFVCTTTLVPDRYDLNFSNAKTTASRFCSVIV